MLEGDGKRVSLLVYSTVCLAERYINFFVSHLIDNLHECPIYIITVTHATGSSGTPFSSRGRKKLQGGLNCNEENGTIVKVM